MGHGMSPGSTGLDTTDTVDDGTTAITTSPPPGAIGLDAKSGGSKQTRASIADLIVGYARRNRGSRVGNGQCFTLVDRALRGADAKTASDFGTISADADYVWGTSVTLADLRPGDVIQFRDYTYERVDVTTDSSGTTTDERAEDRPHHTAIVETVDGNGAVTVLEQNAPEGSAVRRSQLYFSNSSTTHGNRTTRITVGGTFWFYRPEAH